MGVFDRFRKLARGARCVLEHSQIVGSRLWLISCRKAGDFIEESVIGNYNAQPWGVGSNRIGERRLFAVCDKDARAAIIHPQPQRIVAEQREQRHRNRPGLHRAKQANVKRQRRFEHEGDPVTLFDPIRVEPVGKLRRAGRNYIEAQNFIRTGTVWAVGVCNTHRRPARAVGMAGDAFVRDVQVVAVTIEQVPQRRRRGVGLGIGIARKVGQLGHRILSLDFLRLGRSRALSLQ